MSARTNARTKARKKSAALPIEADERHENQVDEFIARNRPALNKSIRQSRKELAEGVHSSRTFDQIVAEGRGRHKRMP
jgi:hypothetical protein